MLRFHHAINLAESLYSLSKRYKQSRDSNLPLFQDYHKLGFFVVDNVLDLFDLFVGDEYSCGFE